MTQLEGVRLKTFKSRSNMDHPTVHLYSVFGPGDSEETFRSPGQAVHLPIPRLLEASHRLFLLLNVKCSILIFIFFSLIRPGIEPKATVSLEAVSSTLH